MSLALSAAFGSALLLCSGSSQALSIVENFAGLSQNDTCALNRCYRPPDTMGAMGNNNYAEMINGAFGVYNRDGTLAAPIVSDIQFWKNAGAATAANASGDSRVLFDPVPGTTLIRPRARSATVAMTRSCSSWSKVGDSPVVPTGETASVSCSTCQSTSRASSL
jgi:hypothetical protein